MNTHSGNHPSSGTGSLIAGTQGVPESSAPSKGQAVKRRPETASKAQSQGKPALTHELEATHDSAAGSSPAEAEVAREHAQSSGSGSASRLPPFRVPGSPRGGC